MAQAITFFRDTAGSGGANLQRFVYAVTFFGDDVSADIASQKQIEIEVSVANNFTIAELDDAIVLAVQAKATTLGLTVAATDVLTFPMERIVSGLASITALSPFQWCRYGVGITSSAGLVSQWADQSGNARHLTKSVATNKPALQGDGSILFDSVDNFLEWAGTLAQPVTYYMLFRHVTWIINAGYVVCGAASTGYLFASVSTPNIAYTSDNVNYLAADVNLAVNTYGVAAWCSNGASSMLKVNNNAQHAGNAGTVNPDGITLGGSPTGGVPYSNIQVKEFIVFNAAHDAPTRATVIDYLASVGGLAI